MSLARSLLFPLLGLACHDASLWGRDYLQKMSPRGSGTYPAHLSRNIPAPQALRIYPSVGHWPSPAIITSSEVVCYEGSTRETTNDSVSTSIGRTSVVN